MSKILFSIVVPLPYWESRGKKQIATLNTTSKWFRYGQKKIKDEYKTILRDFYIPEPPEIPYKSLNITYEILRHNKRKLDGDNLTWAYKWLVDVLTDMKWMVDDDQVYYSVVPSIYTEGLVETQLRVTVREV